MRGEHAIIVLPPFVRAGSSPHARGAQSVTFSPRPPPGIIPACAGSTMLRISSPCLCRDHPRMRGEHGIRQKFEEAVEGSSPHARGAPTRRRPRDFDTGIIPACAGSTSWGQAATRAARDHPRMRGEHVGDGTLDPGIKGSSPHARGARYLLVSLFCENGIIPACAGSTRESRGRP